MTATHLHLVLNHLPILGVPVCTFLLVLGWKRGAHELKRLALVGLSLLGLLVWPVYLTGEPAEESVEHLPGVQESLIEQHEDAAWWALVLTELTAAASLAGLLLIRRREGLARVVPTAVVLLGLLCSSTFVWVGWLGGQIRHSEIRPAAGGVSLPGTVEHDEE